jgi:hypothetical protein
MEEVRGATGFWLEYLKARDHLGISGMNERNNIKMVLSETACGLDLSDSK